MRHIELLKTDIFKIEYNAINEILVANWSGALTNEAIVNGYENIALFLKKQSCRKLLDNHLEAEGIWSDQAKWVAHDWYPRAEKNGLQYHACVYSKSVFSRLSTEQTIKMVQKGIVAGFDTHATAENWLKDL